MNVKVKDRKDNIEFVRMALNLAEIGVDYPNADLIVRIMERLNELKGKFSLKDGIDIHYCCIVTGKQIGRAHV